MTDDVPAQITLYPPSTDVETSYWGYLAPVLWHAGLIWYDYEQVVIDTAPVELRLWCTFTDRHAFDTWRKHELVMKRCPEILASRIDVIEILTPWARHDRLCRCDESSAIVLYGHGFGNRKSVLYCCDCLGYYPNYRISNLIGETEAQLRSWALVSGHVYDIWMLTSELEYWALNELQSANSELNSSGRELARHLSDRLNKPAWYFLFVQSDLRSNRCPFCNAKCQHAKWSLKTFLCDACGLAY